MRSPSEDGVVVWHGTLPNGSCGEICNQGYTVVHEGKSIPSLVLVFPSSIHNANNTGILFAVGHWFGKF
jgi:hypothetical protein